MSCSIVIKSYNKGLAIHMDPQADIEVIKADLASKFKEAAAFFKDAQIVISFEDRTLDSQTERELVNIITENSDVKVICIAGKNRLAQEVITNALNQIEYKNEVQKNSVQVYNGTLKDNAVLDVPGSILILGDVNPGCSIIATGDIYVFGGLFGQAYAGTKDDTHHVVAALDMNPEKLRISGVKYKPDEKPKWSIRNKQTPVPKVAFLETEEYVIKTEAAGKEFWNKFFENTLI